MESCITIKEQTRLYVGPVKELVESVVPKCRVVVITDANIDRLYPDLVRRYERQPKPTLEATEEYLEHDIYYRNPAKENQQKRHLEELENEVIKEM